jgi:hypothetical protein
MNEDMFENPFKNHNVKYLSPTSINKFIANPAKWLVNVAGYVDRVYKPAFTYGNAIEIGITKSIIDGITIKESIDMANAEFDKIKQTAKKSKFDYDEKEADKKQSYVKRTLETVIPVYKEFGTPIASQKKVEYWFDSIPVPLMGYLDLEYEDCVRDLKTTSIKPKKNSNYDRQLTTYAIATNKLPMIDYVYTTTKVSELISFDVENVNMHKQSLERIATKMMNMLSLSSDIKEVCRLSNLEPNLSNDNWWDYWGAREIEGAKQLFY